MPRRRPFGTTWWGEQWIAALEALGSTWANRLPRGRTYARRGAVVELRIAAGQVDARVEGSRPRPYHVRLGLPALPDARWDDVVAELAAEARFTARLLAGEMPRDIQSAFHDAGVSLFPVDADELDTDCSCPDWANPCKHVAAVHYVLAEAFDRDPFLLFEIRGRTREDLLDNLRRARSEGADTAPQPTTADDDDAGDPGDTDTVRLDPGAGEDDFFAARGSFDGLHFNPAPPDAPLTVLRRIGIPPSWADPESPADLLGPVYEAASREALRRALEESREESREDAGEEAPGTGEPDRDRHAERVLALLERRGPLSFRDIEAGLTPGPRGSELRKVINRLREDGRLAMRGRTRAARYRIVG